MRSRHPSGQMMLPMLAVFFMMGVFLIGYLHRCSALYWDMKMDIAARAAALSAARSQAEMLNTMATIQLAQNVPMQKVFFLKEIAIMQRAMMVPFAALNGALNFQASRFSTTVLAVGLAVAKANGATLSAPLPNSQLGHNLKPQAVTVAYLHVWVPAGVRRYPRAFYTRRWAPRTLNAQPDHRLGWFASRGSSMGRHFAQLWLDVKDDALGHNGGFPREGYRFRDLILEGIGFQCGYPQFNARLIPRQ